MSGMVGTPVTAVGNVTSATMDTTGATLLCVSISDYTHDPAGSAVTITDNKGNTWVASGTTGEAWLKCAYGGTLAVGTGHTITVSGGTGPGGGDTQCTFFAFQGFTGPVDKYAFQSHSFSSGGFQPGSITPTNNNSLVISGLSTNSSAAAPFTSAALTVFKSAVVGWGIAVGYVIQGTATAINPTWNWASGFAFAGAYVASFPPSASGFTKNVSDTITITDTLKLAITIGKTEVITLVDTINRAIAKGLTEVISLIEVFKYTQGLVFHEVFSLVDLLGRFISIKLIEVLTLVDTLYRAITIKFKEVINLIDTLRRGISVGFNEVISLLERFSIRNILDLGVTYWRKYILDISTIQIPVNQPQVSSEGSVVDSAVTYFRQYLGRI